MNTDGRSRRLGALTVAAATAVVAGLAAGSTSDIQPVALPVVFGVALATAIDPRLWLVHLALVAVGMVGVDLLPDVTAGNGPAVTFDLRTLTSALVPAFIGAAMVRLACRAAL